MIQEALPRKPYTISVLVHVIDCAREYRRDVRSMIPKQFKTTVGIMVDGHHRQHAATTSHVGGRCKRRREISAQDVAILPIKEFSEQRDHIHVILSTMAGLPDCILKQ